MTTPYKVNGNFQTVQNWINHIKNVQNLLRCQKNRQNLLSYKKFLPNVLSQVNRGVPLESHLYHPVGYPFKYPCSSTLSPFHNMDAEKEAYLKTIYYNVSHPASYSGLDRLHREVKKEWRFQLTQKELKAWLKTQETYGIHKPARRRFKRPRVVVSGIGKQADVDLMDMTQLAEYNDGVRFVLLHIDDFSRYVRTVPLHSKTRKEVAQALKSIFRDGGKTDTLRADKGREWLNKTVQKLLKEEGIHFFHTQNEPKASLAERAIRTIKSIYFKHMTQHQTFRHVDIIQEVTHAYNHRYHCSIRMAPADVTEDNQRQVWHNIYGGDKGFNMKPFTYNIGDWVRISYLKRTFDREYDEKWTREFFLRSAKGNTCRENNSIHWKIMPGTLWRVDFIGRSYSL